MKALNVLIRCDASINIGLGHVTRCLVLANEFKHKGHSVFFAMKDNQLGINKVKEQGFQYFLPPVPFDYHHWITTLSSKLEINIFVGDVRDGLAIMTIEQLKANNILTVAIDEPSDYRKACDLCFYPPHAQLEKLDWQGFQGQIKLGIEYTLLRPEFYQSYVPKNITTPNILIMMGGTDPHQLSLPILHKLLTLELKANFTLLISEDHSDYKAIKDIAKNKKILISNYKNNMPRFLLNVDFAIISFGMTAYELLAMKIPSLHICLNEDHWQASNYFLELGIASRLMLTDVNKIEKNHLDFRAPKIKIKENIIIQEVINATI